MTPLSPLSVRVVHQMPGRARIQLTDAEPDPESTRRLLTALSEQQVVRDVRLNPIARSLLLLHSGELDSILSEAEARGLLVLNAEPPSNSARSTMLYDIKRAIERSNDQVAAQTKGAGDLAGFTFMALVAAGFWQALNGHMLPAGTSLFKYAIDVMRWGADREHTTSPTTEP